MEDTDVDLRIAVDMLVRCPPHDAYEAFADPEQIRRFWLASSSHRLVTGGRSRWRFKIAGAETDVAVVEARPDELLDLRWDEGQPVRLVFTPHLQGAIVGVEVTNFSDAPTAIETMSGFTLVLASLKLWIEHGIEGELQYDRFPDAEYADR